MGFIVQCLKAISDLMVLSFGRPPNMRSPSLHFQGGAIPLVGLLAARCLCECSAGLLQEKRDPVALGSLLNLLRWQEGVSHSCDEKGGDGHWSGHFVDQSLCRFARLIDLIICCHSDFERAPHVDPQGFSPAAL